MMKLVTIGVAPLPPLLQPGTATSRCGVVRPNSNALLMGKQQRALVYCGEGAGSRSVSSTIESLRNSLPHFSVAGLMPEELLEGDWQPSCALLVMPGGADLPYCRRLNGRGNRVIREYVEQGGSYLGLCAGAYYACAHVEFEVGNPQLEVQGGRELAFFPGIAQGCVYPGFHYKTEAGAWPAPLRFIHHLDLSVPPSEARWQECVDYSNGGPMFIWPQGAQLETSLGIGQGIRLGTGQGISLATGQEITVLATYTERNGAAAAVRCQVGKGCAVLCGTHPELTPEHLSAACCFDSETDDPSGDKPRVLPLGAAEAGNGASCEGRDPLGELFPTAASERRGSGGERQITDGRAAPTAASHGRDREGERQITDARRAPRTLEGQEGTAERPMTGLPRSLLLDASSEGDLSMSMHSPPSWAAGGSPGRGASDVNGREEGTSHKGKVVSEEAARQNGTAGGSRESLIAHARAVHGKLSRSQPARQLLWQTLLTAAGLPVGAGVPQ